MPLRNTILNILVVEDNPGDYALLNEYLYLIPTEKTNTHRAPNMATAVELVEKNHFDIALLDLSLPDSSGIDSVITLDRLLPDVPVVVLSGMSDVNTAMESISLGAQDYLVKGEFDEKLLFKTIHYSIERKRMLLKLRQREKELADQELSQQKLITEVTIQAQEKERNELGRELHDNINQVLATIKMYLSMSLDKDGKQEHLLQHSLENVNYAIEEIRKLSRSLVSPSLGDIGLGEALEELAAEINELNTFKVEIVNEISDKKLIDDNMELMFYRVAQEQLNNIRKYAKANKAVITVKTNKENLFFSVADDGIGFDTKQKAQGIGLKNISSRVDFYSGSVKIVSAPDKGCRLEISIPVNHSV